MLSMSILGALFGFLGCENEFTNCEARRTCPLGGNTGKGGSPGDSGAGGAAEGGAQATSGGRSAAGGSVSLGSGGQIADAGAGGEAGNAGAGGAGDGCNALASPGVEPCVATNAHALFVAPNGSDTNAGTRERPLKTLTRAVEVASLTPEKAIIACNAAFRESLVIGAAVRIYGGFGCPGTNAPWTYQPGTAAVLAPKSSGPALSIVDVASDVVIEDMEVLTEDAIEPSSSSIAVAVVRSSSVAFRRTKITAGRGADGAHGAHGEKGANGVETRALQQGADATCTPPAPASGFPAVDGACGSKGGWGAYGSIGAGGPGETGEPLTSGDAPNHGEAGTDGKPGRSGEPGKAGEIARDAGTFSDAGYTPGPSGGAGTEGTTGQGGGGGGASDGISDLGCIGAGGGAGGMGGCGGKGGKGGAAGGASIALLMWDANVSLEACKLVASDGGVGGKGGDGGAAGLGQPGGLGGAEYVGTISTIKKGGNGGPGANGGAGGPGAGGMGGPSLGVVVHGGPPASDLKTTIQVGKAGPGGVGGNAPLAQAPTGLDGWTATLWSTN